MPARKVGIISGTTRPGANSIAFAAWVFELLRGHEGVEYELVHLSDWKLPLLDEPGVPAHSGPTLEHSKAWSAKIASLDGFIFVTPQYNWGYPAALKNALDFLFKEWKGKPGMIVTYGGHGGGKCAAQLHQVLEGLRMQVVAAMPAITIERPHTMGGLTMDDVKQHYNEEYAKEIIAAAGQLEQLLT